MKVALLGTGLMGFPMAQRIIAAGHDVWVYNRTFSKAMALKKEGAVVEAIKRLLIHTQQKGFQNQDYSSVLNTILNK